MERTAAFDAACLPPGLFQYLFLSHEQTSAIIAGGGVDFVGFAGSLEGGQAVQGGSVGPEVEIMRGASDDDAANLMNVSAFALTATR